MIRILTWLSQNAIQFSSSIGDKSEIGIGTFLPPPQLSGLDLFFWQDTYDWAIGISLFLMLTLSYYLYKKGGFSLFNLTAKSTKSLNTFLNSGSIKESCPLLIAIINQKGIIKSVSYGWLHTLGYSIDEVYGQHLDYFMETSPEDLQKQSADPKANRFLTAVGDKVRFTQKSGAAIDLIISSANFGERRGRKGYIMLTFDDITEQLKTEAELQYLQQHCLELQKELELIYHRSTGVHALIDHKFRFKRISAGYADTHKISVKKHFNKSIDDEGPTRNEQVKNDLKSVFETGSPITNTVMQRQERSSEPDNGSWVVHYDPINTGGDSPNFVLISYKAHYHPIDKQIPAEKCQDQGEKLFNNECLRTFGHEIRTPLNAILGFTQIAINRLHSHSIPDDIIQLLNHLRQASQDLSDLVANLVEYSEIEMGETSILLESLKLAEWLTNSFENLHFKANQRKIDFNYWLDPNLPVYVNVDRQKLDYIVQNLLNNAFRNCPQSGKVSINVSKNSDWLLLNISYHEENKVPNQKEGLIATNKSDKNSIFRKHADAEIDLNMVKRQLEILDGRLTIDHQQGIGKTISVEIPIIEVIGMSNPKSSLGAGFFSEDNLVLLVEDNPMNQELMRSFFLDYPFHVEITGDGLSGAQMTKELKPDLVLMDIHMPKLNGLEAIAEIRKDDRCRNIPIIALSADAQQESQAKAFKAGFDGYLPKPFEFDELIPYLERYLKQEKEFHPPVPSLEELPPHILDTLSKEIMQLKEIPKDFANEVLDQIEAIKTLVLPHQSSGSKPLAILQEMETAVYECDSEKLDQLLNELDPVLPS